ncbi:solute carrier family 35 member F2-like [Lampetra fluviatilis]
MDPWGASDSQHPPHAGVEVAPSSEQQQQSKKLTAFPTGQEIQVRLRRIFTRELALNLALGQLLSVLICGTGVCSEYLQEHGVNTPVFQSFFNYVLLLLVYAGMMALRRDDGNLLDVLRARGWKYALLALVDVEANYLVVKAYQYTTLTSVQLLDCMVLPVVFALSWFFLRVRYRAGHVVAVALCLVGVGAMVGADRLTGRSQGEASNRALGDMLVVAGAVLYGVCNVCEEQLVRSQGRVEFLGAVGLFGTLISGVQLAIAERNALASVEWTWRVGLLYAGFACCMFSLYSLMPLALRLTSAASVNLAILTADLYSLFLGTFLFKYPFSALYIAAFLIIISGLIVYSVTPTAEAAVTARPAGPAMPGEEAAAEERGGGGRGGEEVAAAASAGAGSRTAVQAGASCDSVRVIGLELPTIRGSKA